MKAIVTFFILAFSVTALAQTDADKINHIKQVFRDVNSNHNLKKVVIDNDELHGNETVDGGEELTGYFKKDTLVKIVYSVGLSVRNITYEFYFEKHQAIFIFENQQYFPVNNKTGEIDHTKLTSGFEGRYYLVGNKIIQKTEKGTLRGDKGKGLSILKSDIPKYIMLLQRAYLNSKPK